MFDCDANDDGSNEDDLLGTVDIEVSREGGKFKQLIDGHEALRAFQIEFKYKTMFPPEPPDDSWSRPSKPSAPAAVKAAEAQAAPSDVAAEEARAPAEAAR